MLFQDVCDLIGDGGYLIKKGMNRLKANPFGCLVPRAGLEPARSNRPRDFKSLASTNSATQASQFVALSVIRYPKQ